MAKKVITFLPLRDVNPRFFCTQVEAKKADDQRRAVARPDSQLAVLGKTWCDSIRLSAGGIRFDDATIRTCGAIDVAYSWMEKTCLPELTASTNLAGCTVEELRRVLATLYVHSLFVTKLEDASDDQPERDFVLHPCVVRRQRDQMIDWLAALSGVPEESVEAILSVLTFDPNHPHVTLAHQPFVSLSDGRPIYLPRMLLLFDLPRMYIGAINKDRQGRTDYAQRINEIEAAGVELIASEIRAAVSSRFQIMAKDTFHLPDGRQITPDIVVVSDHERAVLVIDVKYATPPFGPGDVHRDLEEMEKWKRRMSKYVSVFQSNSHVLAQHFQWTSQESAAVFGLILLRWPFPIPVDFTQPICAVDWPSLREYLRVARPTSIRDLMGWAYNRPDVTSPMALVWRAKEVPVGAWKYRYFVLAAFSKERVFELTQKLAYRLWEERGRPLWDDLRDWYLAEEQIAARRWLALDPED